MGKQKKHKSCGSCRSFVKMYYGKDSGDIFSVCSMDFRCNSGGLCKFWKSKKYDRYKRRELKRDLNERIYNWIYYI